MNGANAKRRSSPWIGIAAVLLAGAAFSQSGRGTLSGYVAFEDTAAGAAPRARVVLYGALPGARLHYAARTDAAGLYRVAPVAMGEYHLRIEAPGFRTYETTLYLPSDFQAAWAVMLEKNSAHAQGHSP